MIDAPFITIAQAQAIGYIALKVPASEIQHHMRAGIDELFSVLKAQGIAPVGALFTYHNRAPNEVFDFQICVGVAQPIKPQGRVLYGERAQRRVARTVYRGPYDGLGGAWGEHMQWIKSQGLNYADDLWEEYVINQGNEQDPQKFQTQLNRPLID